MRKTNSLDYACLFGGGAIRGAAHIGVLKAFNKLKINPTLLCGSSVGSIVAALYAAGYNYKEIEQIFLDVNFELFRDISFGFSQKFALSKGEVFLEWFRELIEKKFYGDNYEKGKNPPVKFRDIKNNLIIITTNVRSFECKEFSTIETPDFEIAMAVRISCCMPGLMRAVDLKEELLVDGDLMKGKPMWTLSKNLETYKDRILEIRLEGSCGTTDENPLEFVNRMYSCMTFCGTNFIKNIYSKCDKYDYLVIDTGDIVVVDFNCPKQKRQTIIDDGYTQTIEYFTQTLVQKKLQLLNSYNCIFSQMQKIRNLLIIKKYTQAKIEIANLFIFLSETKDSLNQELFNEIKEFQILIFTNIKHGLLGRSFCKEPKKVITSIESILSNLEFLKNDLNNYIYKFKNYEPTKPLQSNSI